MRATADLQGLSLDELESIYVEPRPVAVPTGRYRGTYLARLDTPGARRRRNRLMAFVGFELLPFGVDFTRQLWFFARSWLRVGRFEPRVERSRWRETDTVALHYDVSRLPRRIRTVLYDEVKPLSPTLCLGIGGLNAGPGAGDLFFFALEQTA